LDAALYATTHFKKKATNTDVRMDIFISTGQFEFGSGNIWCCCQGECASMVCPRGAANKTKRKNLVGSKFLPTAWAENLPTLRYASFIALI
jgi:hypothetical protein